MRECYITKTGAYLPGRAVQNHEIERYLGAAAGEEGVKEKILALNGIRQRHYALDEEQNETHSLYELGAEAVLNCLNGSRSSVDVEYLAAGSTNTPLVAPGFATRLHDQLSQRGVIRRPIEINSNAGICSSGAQAIVNAARAVRSGDADTALCVGAEQPSAILRSKVFRPPHDVEAISRDVRTSKWFMSVFLRYMLSDGAGAFLIESTPKPTGLSYRIDWSYSRSFANESPLCMKLESRSLLLSQDVTVLSKHILPFSQRVIGEALEKNGEQLSQYRSFLPHMSSYYFEKGMQQAVNSLRRDGDESLAYWTNLAERGNTGSASIYIMLDEFAKTHLVEDGDRLLLFIPESGQFNFVVLSLTAVQKGEIQ
ncbi:MAG: hypothetical protein KDD64_14530 [Bdellovibrionales bacterium]|nr:hypothetical protein [Bdellovibrionales bacterium]